MALIIEGGVLIGSGVGIVPELRAPDAPTIGTATATDSTTATVSFTAPTNYGTWPITSYTAVSSPGSITGTLSQSGSGTITVSGLTPDTSYTFTVYATNSIGNSTSSSPSNSITPTGTPYWILDNYSQTFAINSVNKTLFAWGSQSFGELGNKTNVGRSSPTQILGSWIVVSAGNSQSAGIKIDGSLYLWGYDANGMGGDGSTTYYRSSPTQIHAGASWSKVASGGGYLLLIKSDGTLWSVGANNYGKLGDGTLTDRSSPVQVGTASNWVNVYTGGSGHTSGALNSNNQLFLWGNELAWGNFGALTTNDQRSSPVMLPGSWSFVSIGDTNVAGIKTDGTLWAWGMNHISTIAGMVGDGTTINRSSPVQVAGGGSWSKVHVLNQVTLAIKTDGTMWGWGGDTYGELGQNSVPLNRSSPTQIGSATNWIDVGKAGKAGDTAVASKTDATVWTWGYGPYGSGSTARRSSPVQVSAFPIDPYYSSVALQLLGENTVNSTTIVDTSSYAWSFTPVTGLYNSNNVTAKEGSQTIRFAQAAGAGKYLSTPSNSAFVVGTNGFTFEAWIYCYASASGFYPIFQGSDFPSAANSFYIGLYRITTVPSLDYAIQMSTGTGGSASYLISVAQAWTASTWFHLAITLAPNSGSPTLWVNGTSLGSGLGSWTTFNSTSYQVGGGIYSGSSYGFAASYMDMIRFTPGVVRYTTTFTPPTVAGP